MSLLFKNISVALLFYCTIDPNIDRRCEEEIAVIAEDVTDLRSHVGLERPLRDLSSEIVREFCLLLLVSDEMRTRSDDRVGLVSTDDVGRGLDLVRPPRFVPVSSDTHTLARVYGPV